MTVVVVLLAIAVGVLALLVFGLLRTHAEILRALDRAGISLDDDETASSSTEVVPERTEVGASADPSSAHDLVGTVPAGGPTKIAVTGVAHFTLLAFLSPGCRTCKQFWEAFAAPDLELPGGDTRLVVVGQDPEHDSESAMADLVPPGVKAVLSSEAWEDYDVPGSPYFVLVGGSDGRVVGAGSALRWEQLRDLLQQALDDAGLADHSRLSSPQATTGHSGRSRAQRADEALKSAGIGSGHPSLYGERSDSNHGNGADSGEALGGSSRADSGEALGGSSRADSGEALGGSSRADSGEALGGSSRADSGEALGGSSRADSGEALGGSSRADSGEALGGSSRADSTEALLER